MLKQALALKFTYFVLIALPGWFALTKPAVKSNNNSIKRGAGSSRLRVDFFDVLTLEPDLGNASVGSINLYGCSLAVHLTGRFFYFNKEAVYIWLKLT